MSDTKQKRLVCGKGVNDLSGETKTVAYKAWKDMLTRCYSEKSHLNRPSYIGCSVAEEWLVFSNFKYWHTANYVKRYQLDKDLLISGNKIYSKHTCIYVPKHINSLLIDSKARRGMYPRGVSACRRGKYQAKCNRTLTNQTNYSSQHTTVYGAAKAYCKAKYAYVIRVIEQSINIGEISSILGQSIISTAFHQLKEGLNLAKQMY